MFQTQAVRKTWKLNKWKIRQNLKSINPKKYDRKIQKNKLN